jgi:hypothetical protein
MRCFLTRIVVQIWEMIYLNLFYALISTRYIENKHFLLAKIKLVLGFFKVTYNYERVVEMRDSRLPTSYVRYTSSSISSISPTRYTVTFGAYSYDSETSISSILPSLRRFTRGTCNILVYASSGRSIARLGYSSTNQSWNTARRSKPNSPRKHCKLATCALSGYMLRTRRRLPKLYVCGTF